MVPTYKIGSFTILEICSFRWEICLFSVTRFASSLGGDFCLHEDNISFSAKRFVCSHFFLWREIRILDWFVFCFRLRVFLRIGGLLYLKKMINLDVLGSMNGGRGHFQYWYLDLRRFLEDFVRFLGNLYWRFVVGLDHKFVVSEVEDLEKWIKIMEEGENWENSNVIIWPTTWSVRDGWLKWWSIAS